MRNSKNKPPAILPLKCRKSPETSAKMQNRPTKKNAEAENVILVDEKDNPVGKMEKLAAHHNGKLHRAFSVVITRINSHYELEWLLQQRADQKYHSGGLWSNACCGHPRPGESTEASASRRVLEELGISPRLTEIGTFVYKAQVNKEMIEHEYDHLFIGQYYHEAISPDPNEIKALKWMSLRTLKIQLKKYPSRFTPWLLSLLTHLCPHEFS